MWLKLKKKLEELLYLSGDESTGPIQFTSNLLRFFYHTGRQLVRDQCLQQASALSFATILSLIPTTILFFVVFEAFGGLASIQDKVQNVLFQYLLADSVRQVSTYVQQIIGNFNSRTIGVIGTAALVVAAYTLFQTIDNTINYIWRTTQKRRLLHRLSTLWMLLTLTPLLIGLSFYLSANLDRLKHTQQLVDISLMLRVFYGLAPFLFTFAALFILNRAVPMTPVKRRAAVVGSLVSAILWEGGKSGFNFYIAHFVSYNKIYGSLGLLPMFLLYIYFTWLVILFGVEITFTLQNLKGLQAEVLKNRLAKQIDGASCKTEQMALEILFLLAHRFKSGEGPLKESDIFSHLGSAEQSLRDAVAGLERSGLIAISEAPAEEERLILLTRNILPESPTQLLAEIQSADNRQSLPLAHPFYRDLYALKMKSVEAYLESQAPVEVEPA